MSHKKNNVKMKNIKKKGGIIIKKIIFLILLSCLIFPWLNVKAETATFYEAEYIDGIYMDRYNTNTRLTYYQQARFFRKTDTNEAAYCLEPFIDFQDGEIYESSENLNLTPEKLDRISKLAYYGYGYQNHTEPKWYAITQLMIWQTSDTKGNYYFTDTLNGNAINRFLEEMNEINNLVNNAYLTPSFSNQKYQIVENDTLYLEDSNNVLNLFQSQNNNIVISNNSITIENLKQGNYTFQFIKEFNNYHTPLIFYQSNTSQNLVKTGDLNTINVNIQVEVIKTNLQVTKIDKDTKSIIPSGDAILDGAIYELYNSNNQKIKEYEIINNQLSEENLPFGTYYLKEIKAGLGYKLNENIIKIEITKDNPNIEVIAENEVIKKQITIQKKYGEENSLKAEENITFHIINKDNNEIKVLTTDREGKIEITLPYGEYTIIQENTTEGYQKIDPITIMIEDEEEETIELKDLRIPVPNTHIDQFNYIELLLLIIKIIL